MNTPEQIPIPRTFIDWAETEALKDYQASNYEKPLGKTMWLMAANKMAVAAFRHLSTPPSDTGARWVRASEKVRPLPNKKTIVRLAFGNVAEMFFNHYELSKPDFHIKYPEFISEDPASAPLQEKGIREAIAARLKELESLIGYVKRERADLPRGSLTHRQATADIEEYRIRYDELNKLPCSPLPSPTDKK